VTFLRSSGGDGFKVAGLQGTGTGTGRMAELVETYLDLPPGIIDAAVAAIAERFGLTGIAALDHRHFTVIRPASCRYSRSCQVPGMPGATPFCSCLRQETRRRIRHCRSVITQRGK
jgi:hypothetical protein